MRPRILIPVRSMYRSDLLPEHVISALEEFAEIEIAVDPAELSRDDYARLFANRDAVLSTWNTPLIDRQVLEQANELKIISHAGGEVRPFISPELFSVKPDLVLCNASNEMAKPEAENTQ